MSSARRLLPSVLFAACAQRVEGVASPDDPSLVACAPSRAVDVAAVGRPMGSRVHVDLPPAAFARAVTAPPSCGAAGRPTAFLRYTAPEAAWVDLLVESDEVSVWALPTCAAERRDATCLGPPPGLHGESLRSHPTRLRAGETVYFALAVDDTTYGAAVDVILVRAEGRAGAYCGRREVPAAVRCEPGTTCQGYLGDRPATCLPDGSRYGACRAGATPCDAGLSCGSSGRCVPAGAREGVCREGDARCDAGLVCAGSRCVSPDASDGCGADPTAPPCAAGEVCSPEGDRVTPTLCRPRGSLGASCDDRAPCDAGLVCGPYWQSPRACRAPLADGAPCDRQRDVCAPGFACAPDGTTSRCLAQGAFGARCSTFHPCRDGLRCTRGDSGTCATVVADGAPCGGSTGALCGDSLVCNAAGRCEHRRAFCPAGQFRTLSPALCVPGRTDAQACDSQGTRDVCVNGSRCAVGRCVPDGGFEAPCRATSPACDTGLQCGAGGVCVAAIERVQCYNGRVDECEPYVGTRCAYAADTLTGHCAYPGTVGGRCLGLPGEPGTCGPELRCVSGTCVATTTPGGPCGLSREVPYACPRGERCEPLAPNRIQGRCVPGG